MRTSLVGGRPLRPLVGVTAISLLAVSGALLVEAAPVASAACEPDVTVLGGCLGGQDDLVDGLCSQFDAPALCPQER